MSSDMKYLRDKLLSEELLYLTIEIIKVSKFYKFYTDHKVEKIYISLRSKVRFRITNSTRVTLKY